MGALETAGYSISSDFTHYILTPDDSVAAYQESSGPNIVEGTCVVTACNH